MSTEKDQEVELSSLRKMYADLELKVDRLGRQLAVAKFFILNVAGAEKDLEYLPEAAEGCLDDIETVEQEGVVKT